MYVDMVERFSPFSRYSLKTQETAQVIDTKKDAIFIAAKVEKAYFQ